MNELLSFEINLDVYDPWANPQDVMNEYGFGIIKKEPDMKQYSAIILAVAHKDFSHLDLTSSDTRVIYDVKSVLPKTSVDSRL
jgi:UDP-N-acetyl-D-galactosamine dehydrogenase